MLLERSKISNTKLNTIVKRHQNYLLPNFLNVKMSVETTEVTLQKQVLKGKMNSQIE